MFKWKKLNEMHSTMTSEMITHTPSICSHGKILELVARLEALQKEDKWILIKRGQNFITYLKCYITKK